MAVDRETALHSSLVEIKPGRSLEAFLRRIDEEVAGKRDPKVAGLRERIKAFKNGTMDEAIRQDLKKL